MLGGVLVLCCLGLIALEALLRGRERYARVGSGAPRKPRRAPLSGVQQAAALALLLAVALLSIGVPFITLGRWIGLGFGSWPLAKLASALTQTAVYALAAGLITTIAAVPIAWLSVRRPGRLQRILEACHTYVGALPGIVIALA